MLDEYSCGGVGVVGRQIIALPRALLLLHTSLGTEEIKN